MSREGQRRQTKPEGVSTGRGGGQDVHHTCEREKDAVGAVFVHHYRWVYWFIF